MIFLHLIFGLVVGSLYGNYTLFFIGASMLPDIDHFYLILKHNLFSIRSAIKVLKKEERHGIHFKTPFMHSIFGLLVCSLLFFVITQNSKLTLFLGLMYLSHLLLDWPDIDKKQYFFPYKKEFRGFLPIWSKTEKIITLIALVAVAIIYML